MRLSVTWVNQKRFNVYLLIFHKYSYHIVKTRNGYVGNVEQSLKLMQTRYKSDNENFKGTNFSSSV